MQVQHVMLTKVHEIHQLSFQITKFDTKNTYQV